MSSSAPLHDVSLAGFYHKKLILYDIRLAILVGTLVALVRYLLAVPQELRHLPRVSPYATIWSYAMRESVDSRVRRLILPFARCGEGVVLVYMLGKWGVHVLDPNVGHSNLPPQTLNCNSIQPLARQNSVSGYGTLSEEELPGPSAFHVS